MDLVNTDVRYWYNSLYSLHHGTKLLANVTGLSREITLKLDSL